MEQRSVVPAVENEKPRMRTTDPSVRVRFMGIHKKITAREAGREQKGNDINSSFQNKSMATLWRFFDLRKSYQN